MESYFDLQGDGGSNILGQVLALKRKIELNLSGIKHMLAIGSGKGGVGKSTLTMQLAYELNRRRYRVAVLDADLNGPSVARLAGMSDRLQTYLPGKTGFLIPKTDQGIGIVSMGVLIPESESLEFESVASGESHVWRATKEFSTLAQILASAEWGALDYLLIDLPPGAERCFQYAEFFGSKTNFILVTLPSELSQGVVARSVSALRKAKAKILGLVENMSGYFDKETESLRPLFAGASLTQKLYPDVLPLGSIPFDPLLAQLSDLGKELGGEEKSLSLKALRQFVDQVQSQLEKNTQERLS